MVKCLDVDINPSQFPSLDTEGFTKTSEATSAYNCFAWSLGNDTRFWAPTYGGFMTYYWPPDAPFDRKVSTFQLIFEREGYEVCASPSLELGFEKVAFYVQGGLVTHAARQIDDGTWTSKLGSGIDLSHTLAGLEGPLYGSVACVMRRPTLP